MASQMEVEKLKSGKVEKVREVTGTTGGFRTSF
jgi:hypothetical protein